MERIISKGRTVDHKKSIIGRNDSVVYLDSIFFVLLVPVPVSY